MGTHILTVGLQPIDTLSLEADEEIIGEASNAICVLLTDNNRL